MSFNGTKTFLNVDLRKPKNVLIAVAMAGVFNFGTAIPASANDPVGDAIHVIECIGLLITDEAKHLAECGTNDNVIDFPDDVPGTAPTPPAPESGTEHEGEACDYGLEGEIGIILGGVCTLEELIS